MPRESMTDDAIEGAFKEQSDKVYLVLLTIEQAQMPVNPLRLVKNNEDIESRGMTFTKANFKYVAPKDGANEKPRASLEVSNIDRTMTDSLLTITDFAKLKIEVIAYPDLDNVIQSFEDLVLRHFGYDNLSVSATLMMEDIFSRAIPADRYDPIHNPGMF